MERSSHLLLEVNLIKIWDKISKYYPNVVVKKRLQILYNKNPNFIASHILNARASNSIDLDVKILSF